MKTSRREFLIGAAAAAVVGPAIVEAAPAVVETIGVDVGAAESFSVVGVSLGSGLNWIMSFVCTENLHEGDLVCILADGRATRYDGDLDEPFQLGVVMEAPRQLKEGEGVVIGRPRA